MDAPVRHGFNFVFIYFLKFLIFFDKQYASLRKVLLAIYLIIVIVFVVALVVIAALAPIEDTVRTIRSNLLN